MNYFIEFKKIVEKNKCAAVIGACILFFVFLYLFIGEDSKNNLHESKYIKQNKSTKKRPVVSAKKIVKGHFLHKISGINGQIDVEKTELGFEVAGIIEHINSKKGSYVNKGDVLAELKGVNLFLKLKYKHNEYEAAKIELKKAENTFAESKEKAETGYILERRLEDERLEVELKKNKVKAAELEYESAKENLTKVKLKAPFNGVVMEKKVGLGQNVDTSKPAFVLLNTSSIYADIEITELDSYKLRIGQKVILNTSIDTKDIEGVVEAIVPAVQGKAMVLSARVKLKTENIKLLPGMFVSGYIVIYEESDVIGVPIEALVKDNQTSYVFIYNPDTEKVSQREVKLGYIADENAVIESGLDEGEFIVSANSNNLKDGDSVILSSY